MPIERIPVTHKFGIISHSYIQADLLKKAAQSEEKARRKRTPQSPFDNVEQFVQEVNKSKEQDSEWMLEKARVFFCRTVRRAGISKSRSQNGSVELSQAWQELLLLSKCKGAIQNEALRLLAICLNQSPMDVQLISRLLEVIHHVAELLLCIKMSTALDCLVTRHLTLLKILFLSASRLLYHYWVGHLTVFSPCLPDLVSCLQKLKQLEGVYENFPGLRLQLLFAVELGSLLARVLGLKEVGEGDNKANSCAGSGSSGDQAENGDGDDDVFGVHEQEQVVGVGKASAAAGRISCNAPGDLTVPSPPQNSVTPDDTTEEVSVSHDVLSIAEEQCRAAVGSPAVLLIHAIAVWRLSAHGDQRLRESLEVFRQNRSGLSGDSWLYGVVILNILSSSSLVSLPVLQLIQQLATLSLSDKLVSSKGGQTVEQSPDRWPWQLAYSFGHCLGTIAMNTELSAIAKSAVEGSPSGDVGLVSLRQFSSTLGRDDWILRYSAVESLARIAEKCQGPQNGLHTVAWSSLLECESTETDSRVLEAVKMGQAAQISEDRHLFCEITDSLSTQTSVFDRIANGLAHFYDHMEAMRRHQRQDRSVRLEKPKMTPRIMNRVPEVSSISVTHKRAPKLTIRDQVLEQVGVREHDAISRHAQARAVLNQIAEEDLKHKVEAEIGTQQP